MTQTNYSDYGLNPDKDFSADLTTARKQLNLLKYIKHGFIPWLDPMCPVIFSEDERVYIELLKRSTVRGRWCLDVYRQAAGLFRYAYFFKTIAENYQSIVIRVARDRTRTLTTAESYEPRYTRASIKGIKESVNNIIVLIDKKYGIHGQTKIALGFDFTTQWRLIQDAKEELEKINCVVCGKRHNNKRRFAAYRGGGNRIRVFECVSLEDIVQPYCIDCAEVFARKKAKEDYKAEKALKEAREIGGLLRKIKQEIKANEYQD